MERQVQRVSLQPRGPRSNANANRVKRPINAFMIWSQQRRKEVAVQFPNMRNADISKQLGLEWRSLPHAEKAPYLDEAKQLRAIHLAAHPDYKFQPRRNSKQNVVESSKNSNPAPNFPYVSLSSSVIRSMMDTQDSCSPAPVEINHPYHDEGAMASSARCPTSAAASYMYSNFMETQYQNNNQEQPGSTMLPSFASEIGRSIPTRNPFPTSGSVATSELTPLQSSFMWNPMALSQLEGGRISPLIPCPTEIYSPAAAHFSGMDFPPFIPCPFSVPLEEAPSTNIASLFDDI